MQRCLIILVAITLVFFTTNAETDIRQRFEGLVGKSVHIAWHQIDREGLFVYFEILT